jgi:hypothetical protein
MKALAELTAAQWSLIVFGATIGLSVGLLFFVLAYHELQKRMKATGRVFYAVKSGAWSDPDVWNGHEVPAEGDTIGGFRSGARVTLDKGRP